MMARSHEEVRESTMPAVAEPAGEIVFQGIAAAPGIAIGPAYVYARESQDHVERRSIGDDFEAEIARFESAVERSEHDLKKIASVAGEKLGKDSAAIFDALAMMLRDERLYDAVIAEIRDHRVNADYAVQEVMTGHRQMMKASDSEYLRERAADLLDLQDRLIRHLRHGKLLSAIEPNCIVIAESVTASDIVLFSRRGILGVGMEFGGPTSHVALMARALDVPAVVSLHDIVDYVNDGDTVILDGISGRLIVRPSAEVLERHEGRRDRYQRLRLEQEELAGDPTRTLDDVDVQLMANIEFEEELRLMKAYGADGIGLFRTEIMVLLQQSLAIAEDEQYRIYSKIVSETAPKPTVIRVLDLGGDKILPMGAREQNPFLGWRGIRLLLDKPEMLIPQLRAILRASHLGPVKILLPMVTNLEEVALFREVLKRVEDDLEREGGAQIGDFEVGIMVEVPAVAMMADVYAEEADFLSIGTNDLTQYTLAVDRGNDLVSDKYDELHPAVLKLIKSTIDAGLQANVPVSMCGEMASNPRSVPVLYGLGLRSFSISPVYLPQVKRIIRTLETSSAEALARGILECRSIGEVNRYLDRWLETDPCGRKVAAEIANGNQA